MKITVLVIGLALAAIVGVQSFAILTTPFMPAALAFPASLGIIIALLLVVGAGFAMSMFHVATACFAVAGIAGFIAGQSTPYNDLRVWGIVAVGLAGLCFFAGRKPGPRTPSAPFQFGSYEQVPPDIRSGHEKPITPQATVPVALKAPVPPTTGTQAAEGKTIDQLERLAALRASGSLSDEEFATLKANVLKQEPL